MAAVAPLTGSVDRNSPLMRRRRCRMMSLPSRGAWIEIILTTQILCVQHVAPLTGSVDRNIAWNTGTQRIQSRSPHGERG